MFYQDRIKHFQCENYLKNHASVGGQYETFKNICYILVIYFICDIIIMSFLFPFLHPIPPIYSFLLPLKFKDSLIVNLSLSLIITKHLPVTTLNIDHVFILRIFKVLLCSYLEMYNTTCLSKITLLFNRILKLISHL